MPVFGKSTTRRRRSAAPQGQPDLVAVGYDGYQEAVYSQLKTMIERPVTPMVAPAKTIRTLILPYTDNQSEGRLYMPRYVFSVLQGPKFVLGDYLTSGERDLAGTLANGLFTSPASTAGSPKRLTPTAAAGKSKNNRQSKSGN
ncbi:MAG: TraV family lipoprotein [Pseudomonadota bacterium]